MRCLIGDVRGKGLEAVATAAVVLGSFGEAAHDQPDLARLAERRDASARRHADDDEAFVTARLVEVDATAAARVLSCGHPAPYLRAVLPDRGPAGRLPARPPPRRGPRRPRLGHRPLKPQGNHRCPAATARQLGHGPR
ncbi:SpoIIE family protein phosphatase [Yinghuangia aomiensis]|uniref:SpoIIE family protein phosphatase n=1 Tax=Yinghuangia aomiensis TaxID=676205 RepID=UPI003CD06979